MAGAGLNPGRRMQDFFLFLEPVLRALLQPLHAEGAAFIALDDRAGTPVKLYATGNAPSALLDASDLLLAGLRSPCHGLP
jgi:hypothetical protein